VILLLASILPGSCLQQEPQDFTVFYVALSAGNNGTTAFSYERLVLAIVGLVLSALAVLASQELFRSRHSRAIEREARRLGLTFSVAAKPFIGSDVHGLTPLQGDPSLEAANIVQGTVNGLRALVLEVPFCEVCEEETPCLHFTTVAAFRCPGCELPEFEIGRKGPLSKVADALWRKPAVVDDREFAKDFFVCCEEPARVHDWLTPAKLAELRQPSPPFHISANVDWILICRPGVRIRAQQMAEFLRETSRVAAALLQNAVSI
jgi:hypothetical protein